MIQFHDLENHRFCISFTVCEFIESRGAVDEIGRPHTLFIMDSFEPS